MATTEMLNKVLSELMKTGEIESSVIASRDGLLMVSRMQKGDDETFAAMSATMLGAAETASAGPKALVVVLTPPEISLGLVLVELGKAADEIKKILT